jgi:hypothetical protein
MTYQGQIGRRKLILSPQRDIMPPAARRLQETNPQGDNYERGANDLTQPELYPEPIHHEEAESIPQTPEPTKEHERIRRSHRVRKKPSRQKDYVPHEEIAFETLKSQKEVDNLQHPILAMRSTSDPDTMYLWQAKKEEDYPQFQIAMQKEIDDHTSNRNWKLKKR